MSDSNLRAIRCINSAVVAPAHTNVSVTPSYNSGAAARGASVHGADQLDSQEDCTMHATSLTRRDVLAGTAAATAAGFLGDIAAAADSDAIRPFRVSIPDEQLVELRRRIAATRWPDRETVNDRSQGT